MSAELTKLPNTIVIEGHTDSKPFSAEGGYSNWELSSDRANAARRVMAASGLRADQIKQVRGFADQRLMDTGDPSAAKNRRISIIVQYQQPIYDPKDDEVEAQGAKTKAESSAGRGTTKPAVAH
jgi:chemotaxis protein MotB